MTVYAPVLITTLCRSEYFKKCLESLSANSWAKYTPVYVALDYPFKDEHWDGYYKIKDFLKGTFNFKELIIIERTINFGPYKNMTDARELLYQKYDRIIASEDDNIFSPNFLEYINKGLEKFEHDEDIIAICGYNWPIIFQHKYSNFLKQGSFFMPWGVGRWKNKDLQMNPTCNKSVFYEKMKLSKVLSLALRHPKIFRLFVTVISDKEDWFHDAIRSVYMNLNKKYIIQPTIPKVKNIGVMDSEGITACYNQNKKLAHYLELKIDEQKEFEFQGDAVQNVEFEKLLNKINSVPYSITKKDLFKAYLKFCLAKIFGLEFIRKHWPAKNPYSPLEFAKMRAAYLEQKNKKGEENA